MLCGKPHQLLLIDQIPSLTVGHGVQSVAQRNKIHADSRRETAKKKASGTKDAPEFGNHRLKLLFASSEVKDRAADDDVRKFICKRHFLDATHLEIFVWQAGIQRFGQSPNVFDPRGIRIDRKNFRAFAQQDKRDSGHIRSPRRECAFRARCCRAGFDRTRRCRSHRRVPGCSESSDYYCW